MRLIFLLVAISTSAFSQISNVLVSTKPGEPDTINRIISQRIQIDSSLIVCDTVRCWHQKDTTMHFDTTYQALLKWVTTVRFSLFSEHYNQYKIVVDGMSRNYGHGTTITAKIDSVTGDTITTPGNDRVIVIYSDFNCEYSTDLNFHAVDLSSVVAVFYPPNSKDAKKSSIWSRQNNTKFYSPIGRQSGVGSQNPSFKIQVAKDSKFLSIRQSR